MDKYLTVGNHTLGLTLIDGVYTTTTIEIAKCFERRHDNVMSKFRRDHKEQYESFRAALQLEGSEYKDVTGKSNPMWLLKDRALTYMLIVQTGTIANRYKAQFVDEFHVMRDLLTQEQLSSNKLNLANQMLSPSTKYIDHRTDLVEAQLEGQELMQTLSMSTFANLLNQTNMIIGRTSLYALLRDMGLVQYNSCEPTKLGLDYLMVKFTRVDGNLHMSSKVKVSHMLQLVTKIQNRYINIYIKNNNLIGALNHLNDLMVNNPDKTNDDLIVYLRTNLPELKVLNDSNIFN